MKHGPVFGEVDFVAAEHGFDAITQFRFLGQADEELERVIGDPVLRVIQEQPDGFDRHSLAALRVIGEKFSEMQLADFFVMRGEGFPGAALGQGFQS